MNEDSPLSAPPIRLLLVEDSNDDAELIVFGLNRAAFRFEHRLATDADEFKAALAWNPQVIVCDYRMPSFGALEALRYLSESGCDIPLIVVSRHVGEETAVDALHRGASDYLLKDRLARLPQALERVVALAVLRRDRVRASLELEQVNRQLRALSARLLTVQEEERAHIARELHDQLGHTLTAIRMQFDSLAREQPRLRMHDGYQSAVHLLAHAMTEVRNLSTLLFPPQLKLIGLGAAIEALAAHWRSAKAGTIETLISAKLPALPDALLIAAYRIVQEALTNAVRHSGFNRIVVTVALSRGSAQLVLTVEDDGHGFDLARALQECADGRSIGLTSLQQRSALVGGTVTITSKPGAGCTVRARLPLPALEPQ